MRELGKRENWRNDGNFKAFAMNKTQNSYTHQNLPCSNPFRVQIPQLLEGYINSERVFSVCKNKTSDITSATISRATQKIEQATMSRPSLTWETGHKYSIRSVGCVRHV
eukprot:GHVT01087773.1.p1 GENE.GHVT01087773.1~~GHVT01087773.1.p1  ORF type:complete len:109 (+),score=4.64 GHVT01087773.1:710-1036(+)